MGSKKRSLVRGERRKKRADRVVRPYKVQRKIVEMGGRRRPPRQGAVEGDLPRQDGRKSTRA